MPDTPEADPNGSLAATGCNESAYLRDTTVEDGTELAPGQAFTKTWQFKNIGICAWSKAYSIQYVSGSSMDGADTSIDRAVKPGEAADISVSLLAPPAPGTYTGYWTLADKNGTGFGEKVYVEIVVAECAGCHCYSLADECRTDCPRTQACDGNSDGLRRLNPCYIRFLPTCDEQTKPYAGASPAGVPAQFLQSNPARGSGPRSGAAAGYISTRSPADAFPGVSPDGNGDGSGDTGAECRDSDCLRRESLYPARSGSGL